MGDFPANNMKFLSVARLVVIAAIFAAVRVRAALPAGWISEDIGSPESRARKLYQRLLDCYRRRR